MKSDILTLFRLWSKCKFPYVSVHRHFHYGKKQLQNFWTERPISKQSYILRKKHVYFLSPCSQVVQQFHKSINTNSEYNCFEDEEYKELIQPIWNVPQSGHHVIVLQPDFIISEDKSIVMGLDDNSSDVAPELLLKETISLIQNLKNWTVKQQVVVPIKKLDKYLGFDSADVKMLTELISTARKQHGITAVVVSTSILLGPQLLNLHSIFNLPVYDRYFIALEGMKQTANSKEALLQIGLAEIQLIYCRLDGTYGKRSVNIMSKGTGESFIETRHQLLRKREMKLKLALRKLKSKVYLIKSSPKTKDYPIISVVGYTNTGKTSLIRALTKNNKLEPNDKLLSTLDLSAYTGILPNGTPVIYLDTMGFITDLPYEVMRRFFQLLKEIQLSDLLIHVRSIDHPNYYEQKQTVLKLLKLLKIPSQLLDTMIEVNNKVDLLTREVDSFSISSLTGEGIPLLLNTIQEKAMKALKSKVVL